jgi:hypothetical protein
MSKYIIDIPDGFEWGVVTCRTEDGFYTRDFDFLEELNSDYINEHYGELQDEAYQAGMDKAWEIARRIRLNCEDGGIDGDGLRKIFGTANNYTIIKDNTASEAIAKIKAYDNATHSDSIEVGDIVDRYIDGKFDSRGIYLGGNGEIWDCLFWANTLPITLAYPKEQFIKTGKHYDIQSILEAMRK